MIYFGRNSLNSISKKSLYWWEPQDKTVNVGDQLSFDIVNLILAYRSKNVYDKISLSNKLLAIGSVMHFAKNNDTVWGTGINGKINDKYLKFNKLDVRAVRGPLTREKLIKKGIKCPEVFGDPAILTPLLYPREIVDLQNSVSNKEFIVIPHLRDDLEKYRNYSDNIVSPECYPLEFIRAIASAKMVVSSSLHGVIIAESYGIPAVYYKSGSGEHDFKYHDYYLGTGRSENEYNFATSIEEALTIKNEPIKNLQGLQAKLIEVFPLDLWL